jgi:hypothetical protein
MEVVTNLSNAATKTIWGDNNAQASGKEPVSGKQGAGTATDPYDKGNEESKSRNSWRLTLSESILICRLTLYR